MLLFSTILNLKPSVAKEDFVQLVIKWNNENPRPANVIPGVEWNGKIGGRYGADNLWMSILEYSTGNVVAVRYEKIEEDGVIWNTDYIANFNEHKLAIQLDRSYTEEALKFNPEFSTPHFITLLINAGYLQDDLDLPVSRTPIELNMDNAELLPALINARKTYYLPVVYVSKNEDDEDPVDVTWLAGRLKGAGHVLVEKSFSMNRELRTLCDNSNAYNGAIEIYFPNISVGNMRLLSGYFKDNSRGFLEKTIRLIIQYVNSQNIPSRYTWNGVTKALLGENLKKQFDKVAELDFAVQKAANEVEDVYGTFDDELTQMRQQLDELEKSYQALLAENMGLKTKLDILDEVPVIKAGKEQELYPGEFKEMILAVLDGAVGNLPENSRRADVLRDVIENNGFERISEDKAARIKKVLKAYDGLTSPAIKELKDLGFEIQEDGKHYKLVYFGDGRYWITLAKTPSDVRGGKNVAAEIIKGMF